MFWHIALWLRRHALLAAAMAEPPSMANFYSNRHKRLWRLQATGLQYRGRHSQSCPKQSGASYNLRTLCD
ncbi:MAG: hypothetical protein AAFU78_23765, partial [Cyanobacteria bacterium J06633_2]